MKSGLRSKLSDIAAALARVEAVLRTGVVIPGPDASAALERIADIAFVLHERAVEPSLCDALDAAVREIADAGKLRHDAALRAAETLKLLREALLGVDQVIAVAGTEAGAEPAATLQTCAASETELDDGAATDSVAPDKPDLLHGLPVGEIAEIAIDYAPEIVEPPEPALAAPPYPGPALDPDEDPGELFEPVSPPPALPESGRPSASPPFEATMAIAAPIPVPEPPLAHNSDLASAPREEVRQDVSEVHAAPIAAQTERPIAAPIALQTSSPAAIISNPAPALGRPSAHSAPRPMPTDPLAAVRALSEEETIALFS